MTTIYDQINDSIIKVTMPVNHVLCNTVKQIMANDIPTYAIERVVVYKNDSVITSDILCQRLGLVPIKVDPKDTTNIYSLENREIKFVLSITCTEPIMHIYTNDLVVEDLEGEYTNDIITKDIHLSTLTKGQQIEIECYAIVSTGSDHIKWSPVCAPTFVVNGPNSCTLTVESSGSRKPLDIYNESVDKLIDQLNDIAYTI